MADAVVLLQQLGFGEYEARAYVALLQHGPASGYEIAKVSGIPRPNTYTALQKLEERGAAVRRETSDATHYAAVSPQEFLRRTGAHFHTTLTAAESALEEVTRSTEPEHVWSADGYSVVLDHARTLVDNADAQVLVALWPEEASILADTLAQAERRNLEVTTLCLAACPEECGGCRGSIYRYRVVRTPEMTRWLMVVADAAEVLTAEIQAGDRAAGVRTRQRLLVETASWFIRHSIALASVLNDLGDSVTDVLSPETQATLKTIGPTENNGGWLEYMRTLLNR